MCLELMCTLFQNHEEPPRVLYDVQRLNNNSNKIYQSHLVTTIPISYTLGLPRKDYHYSTRRNIYTKYQKHLYLVFLLFILSHTQLHLTYLGHFML